MPIRLMMRSGTKRKEAAYGGQGILSQLQQGDICLASQPRYARRSAFNFRSSISEYQLATLLSKKPLTVKFFDDITDTPVKVKDILPLPASQLAAHRQRFEAALGEAKRLAADDSLTIVRRAIASVTKTMGGKLSVDGQISFTNAGGRDPDEGRLLCDELLGNFAVLAVDAGATWMAAHWEETCLRFDVDRSGTISEAEAVMMWDDVAQKISEAIAAKKDLLGKELQLHRGDLCLAWPVEAECDPKDPDRRLLATYVDENHVVFFDGDDTTSAVRAIEVAPPKAKESAILRCARQPRARTPRAHCCRACSARRTPHAAPSTLRVPTLVSGTRRRLHSARRWRASHRAT
jgi:hypothetical protein